MTAIIGNINLKIIPEKYNIVLNKLCKNKRDYNEDIIICIIEKEYKEIYKGKKYITDRGTFYIEDKTVVWNFYDEFTFTAKDGEYKLYINVYKSDAHFETFILPYILNIILAQKGLFMVHGSCAIKDNEIIFFIGPTGSGKSMMSDTLIEKGYKKLCDDKFFISDDKIYFPFDKNTKHSINIDKTKKIFLFPEIGDRETKNKISYSEAVNRILLASLLPNIKSAMESGFKNISDFINDGETYRVVYKKGKKFIADI